MVLESFSETYKIDTEGSDEIAIIPVGPLGIIAMDNCSELGGRINEYLVGWRKQDRENNGGHHLDFPGHVRDTFLISAGCPRFGNGEGKGIINETIRGHDLFIISDIGNYSRKYKVFDQETCMTPDDHYQDIKRIISAVGGKARRVTVIMPMLYEARQHRRIARESLDCAMALQELQQLGVDNILTFDAHDPKVQNAVPLIGFENVYPTYQVIKAMVRAEPDIEIHKDKMMLISPDEGGMNRSLYYANVLGLNIGMFYKRRDLTKLVNGRNPIVAHEYLGDKVEGKTVLITDDLIASGESVLDVARELKKYKAKKILVAVTFGLFTEGIEKFNKAHEDGIIDKIFSTNLTYRRPELKEVPWYVEVDMAKYIAYLIEALNHDVSLSPLIDPAKKIGTFIEKHKSGE